MAERYGLAGLELVPTASLGAAQPVLVAVLIRVAGAARLDKLGARRTQQTRAKHVDQTRRSKADLLES